jgi:hypothetical protein
VCSDDVALPTYPFLAERVCCSVLTNRLFWNGSTLKSAWSVANMPTHGASLCEGTTHVSIHLWCNTTPATRLRMMEWYRCVCVCSLRVPYTAATAAAAAAAVVVVVVCVHALVSQSPSVSLIVFICFLVPSPGQLLRVFNMRLQEKRHARARRAMFHAPDVVRLSPTVRLIQATSSYTSLQAVWHTHAEEKGMDWEAPRDAFIAGLTEAGTVYGADMDSPSEEKRATRARVLTGAEALVPRTLLRDFALRLIRTVDHFYVFRRQLATHLGMQALLGYALSLRGADAASFMLAVFSGELAVNVDSRTSVFDKHGALLPPPDLLVRLSPSVVECVGPTLMASAVPSAALCAARCFSSDRDTLGPFLRQMIADLAVPSSRGAEGNVDARVLAGRRRRAVANAHTIEKRIADVARAPPVQTVNDTNESNDASASASASASAMQVDGEEESESGGERVGQLMETLLLRAQDPKVRAVASILWDPWL